MTTIVDTPPVVEQAPPIDLLNYSDARTVIDEVYGQWADEIRETEENRRARLVDLDVEQMRQNGELMADETFIPERLIDSSIQRELPTFLAFLNKSRRLAIFRSLDNPTQKCERLENEFTLGLSHIGWLKDWSKFVDGALLHGWDNVEVMFDPTKPLHVSLEHIGHDKLMFNRNCSSIQDSEVVVRVYDLTSMKLREFVRNFSFDQKQVDLILSTETNTRRVTTTYSIFKVYMKIEGIVYVAWCVGSDNKSCSDWLKAPDKLRIGISEEVEIQQNSGNLPMKEDTSVAQGAAASVLPSISSEPIYEWRDKDIDMYPIFVFEYKDTEEEVITDHVGRAFLDKPRQEAHTCIVTSFVNSMNRASNVMAAPENPDDGGNESIHQLDVPLESGVILNKALKFFHMDYPPVEILSGLQQLDVRNMQQTGNVDYAVMNRKDARKTATEMSQAQQESELIKSVPLSLYSEFLREILNFCWQIVKSQALQNKIKFLLIPQVVTTQSPTGPIEQETGEYVNDVATIDQEYDIRAAGDVDYIQRVETIKQMENDWPVIQTTGAASEFLQDLIKLKYPDTGDKYAKLLVTNDPVRVLLKQVTMTLAGALQPEEVIALDPGKRQELINLQQQVLQTVGVKFLPEGTDGGQT